MKPRAHSYLLLLLTLVIGIILGALIQSQIRGRHIKHISIMSSEERFIEAFVTAIGPTDPDQAEKVRTILADYAPRVLGTIRDSRVRVRSELDDMKVLLVPLLDPEQQERLEERMRPPKYLVKGK